MTAHSSWLHSSWLTCSLLHPVFRKPTSHQPVPAKRCLPWAKVLLQDRQRQPRCRPCLESLACMAHPHPQPPSSFSPNSILWWKSKPIEKIWGFSSMTIMSKVGRVFPRHSTGIPQPCREVLESTRQKGRTGVKRSGVLFMASLLGSDPGGRQGRISTDKQ